ncbi:MAG: YicC family protein [Firmicutes bacterium]|nr:YicC family protein [Bacillota bacterium]
MIHSMTGFGRSEYSDDKRNITVEIRSVNHRYLDLTVKMSRRYSFCEEKIKQAVKERISRGKVEVSVMVENISDGDTDVTLNKPVARRYYDSLTELKNDFELKGDIDLRLLSSMPDVLKVSPDLPDEDEFTQAVLVPVRGAVTRLEEMRAKEGSKLAEDLINKGDYIRTIVDSIKERSPLVVKEYTEKLRAHIADLIGGSTEIPEERILTEAAIFADKSAVDEEMTRLDSHLIQLKNILTGDEPAVGKKLDFLVQEMNREANTTGSKANDLDITNMVLELKSEIEKIREQVQNIE